MMARIQPAPNRSWVEALLAHWPVVLSALAVIAFVVNTQRDIVEMKQTVSATGQRLLRIDARQDTLTKGAEVRDYMICKVFETLVEKDARTRMPKRCDDVFQGWGP